MHILQVGSSQLDELCLDQMISTRLDQTDTPWLFQIDEPWLAPLASFFGELGSPYHRRQHNWNSAWNNPRCSWCRRLWRFYHNVSCWTYDEVVLMGDDLCDRCLIWCRRNQCLQKRDALCSKKGGQNKNALLLDIALNRALWNRIVTILCGSIPESGIDMNVQTTIWQQVLIGSGFSRRLGPFVNMQLHPRDTRLNWCFGQIRSLNGGHDASMFIKLCMVEVWPGTAKVLIPRYNSRGPNRSIICIVIAFLEPIAEFGLVDGYTWNRGWRYE